MSAPRNASSGSRDATVGDDNAASISSSSSSSSAAAAMQQLLASVLKDRTSEGGAVTKTISSSPGDTCTWYASKQCSVARSCFDCLNTRLSGDATQRPSCMVDTYGVCVSMNQYKVDKDFRRPRPPHAMLGSSMNQYPSTNATYCADNDASCAVCRDNWGNPFDNSQLSYLPFCRGAGGCVCVQACESPYHNDNVIMQRCIAYGYAAPSAKTVYTSIGFLLALCCVVTVVTFVVRRWMRRTRANAQPAFRHDLPLPQRAPAGPRLGLSGWHSMREKLIETEREQLEGTTTDDAKRAVPVLDSSGGVAVPLEASDAYLPASSPREQAHHQEQEPRSERGDDHAAQLRRRASSESTAQGAEPADSTVREL